MKFAPKTFEKKNVQILIYMRRAKRFNNKRRQRLISVRRNRR